MFLNAQESQVNHLSLVMIDLGMSTADKIKRHGGRGIQDVGSEKEQQTSKD